MLNIRKETPADYAAVREVNESAFGQNVEATIVEKLRVKCDEFISLVAVKDSKVVGHIMFSPVLIKNDGKQIKGMALGPMAVMPELQNHGIGSRLVNTGIAMLEKSHCPFIIVLGHDKYYPRFGFKIASKFGLKPQWEGVPDEAFMVLFLDKSITKNTSGIVYYREEFNITE